MGCAPSAPRRAPAKTKTESRESAWRATGIVALRDSNLRELPDKLFDADGELRDCATWTRRTIKSSAFPERLKRGTSRVSCSRRTS